LKFFTAFQGALFVAVYDYYKVIAQRFGIIEIFDMPFVDGVEISGDYDGFFHFFNGCWV
jgi:hypothetical protein